MYAYQADIYCDDCGDAIKRDLAHMPDDERNDSDNYPQWASDSSEADASQHCADCGEFLRNELTDDGRRYVIDALARGAGDPAILGEWANYYGLRLERGIG